MRRHSIRIRNHSQTPVTAYSYDIKKRVDVVSVHGGDGRFHTVPVEWEDYIPLEESTNFYISTSEIAESKSVLARHNGLCIFTGCIQQIPELSQRQRIIAFKVCFGNLANPKILLTIQAYLKSQENMEIIFVANDGFAALKELSAEMGVKIGFLMWPIRTAVSGKQNTPGGATEIMEIIGKEESIKRIKAAILKLEQN